MIGPIAQAPIRSSSTLKRCHFTVTFSTGYFVIYKFSSTSAEYDCETDGKMSEFSAIAMARQWLNVSLRLEQNGRRILWENVIVSKAVSGSCRRQSKPSNCLCRLCVRPEATPSSLCTVQFTARVVHLPLLKIRQQHFMRNILRAIYTERMRTKCLLIHWNCVRVCVCAVVAAVENFFVATAVRIVLLRTFFLLHFSLHARLFVFRW